MSKTLRDKAVDHARAFVARREEIMRNADLTDQAKAQELSKAREDWQTKNREILSSLTTSKQSTTRTKKVRSGVTSEEIATLKTLLQESTDPGIEALELVMQGDTDALCVLTSEQGKIMLANVLKQTGDERSTVADLTVQIGTAAQKRLSQVDAQLAPDSTDDKTTEKSARFYDLVIPTMIADLGDAIEHNRRVVVVPNEDGEPDEIDLTGTEG